VQLPRTDAASSSARVILHERERGGEGGREGGKARGRGRERERASERVSEREEERERKRERARARACVCVRERARARERESERERFREGERERGRGREGEGERVHIDRPIPSSLLPVPSKANFVRPLQVLPVGIMRYASHATSLSEQGEGRELNHKCSKSRYRSDEREVSMIDNQNKLQMIPCPLVRDRCQK